jgi:DNA adenine methylase
LVNVSTKFTNNDFRDVLGKIQKRQMHSTFIYCDPPYLGTCDNYSSSFKEQDAVDLFDVLVAHGSKFAYSEFDHPFILEQAKSRNLYVNIIGERQSLKKRSVEILVTNYETKLDLFD